MRPLGVLALLAVGGCPTGDDPPGQIALTTQGELEEYAANAPEVEHNPIHVTGEVDDLSPLANSALKEIDELAVSVTVRLTALAGIDTVTRIGSLIVDQNEALTLVDLSITEASSIGILGGLERVLLDKLETVELLNITGHACDISLDALVSADDCTITTARADTCEPPPLSAFPACL